MQAQMPSVPIPEHYGPRSYDGPRPEEARHGHMEGLEADLAGGLDIRR